MPVENYRYCRVDNSGHVHGTEWFYATSDQDAVTQVASKHPNDRCEVWQGERLVQKLDPYPTVDLVAGSERTLAEARRVLKETAYLVAPDFGRGSQGDTG